MWWPGVVLVRAKTSGGSVYRGHPAWTRLDSDTPPPPSVALGAYCSVASVLGARLLCQRLNRTSVGGVDRGGMRETRAEPMG